MIPILRGKFWTITSAAIALSLLWLGVSFAPAHADTPPLTLTVEGPDLAVLPMGATAQFTVSLENTDTVTRTAAISTSISGAYESVRIMLLAEESAGYHTARALRRPGNIGWGGGLAPGGKIVFSFIAKGKAIVEPEMNGITVAAAAGPTPQNLLLQEQASVQFQVPSSEGLDISLDAQFTDAKGNPIPGFAGLDSFEEAFGVPPGQPFRLHLSLTQNENLPVVVFLNGAFAKAQVAAALASNTACEVQVTGMRVAEGQGTALPAATIGATQWDYAAFLTLPPQGKGLVIIELQTVGGFDCALQHEVELRARALPAGTDRPLAASRSIIGSLLESPPTLAQVLILIALLSDLGDAPDSTNHAGVSMDAYPGVTANFPTVFNPATGLPQGPKHRFPRALHLGAAVSWELEADLALFAGGLNIDPPNNVADLDLHDDGVDVAAMSFRHCLTTLMPVQVTWSQVALDYLARTEGKVYINAWLDGNRDGVWANGIDCDGIRAPEHIVIDHEIVAPGGVPGTYQYLVPTSNLPIPLNQTTNGVATQEMWLRVTLSEQPSVKTGKFLNLQNLEVEFGDGRGPAQPFLLGETEDYLVRPAGIVSSRGPDLALDGAIERWQDVIVADGVQVEAQILKRLRIRNLGDTASGGKLIIETTPYLGMPEVVSVAQVETAIPAMISGFDAGATQSGVEIAASTQTLPLALVEICAGSDPCYLEASLADLQPGSLREFFLRWKVEEGEAFTLSARLEASLPDAKPDNNSFLDIAKRPIRTLQLISPRPGTVGMSEPLTATATAVGVGVESAGVLELSGIQTASDSSAIEAIIIGEPGAVVGVNNNGGVATQLTLDADGRGTIFIPITEGHNLITLFYVEIEGLSEQEVTAYNQAETLASSFVAMRGLPWDPASFRIEPVSLPVGKRLPGGAQVAGAANTMQSWPVVGPDDNSTTEGWILPIIAGREMEVTLRVSDLSELLGLQNECCLWPPVSLQFGDAPPIPLTRQDDLGMYATDFTLSEVEDGAPVSLIIGCDEDDENAENATFGQCWVFSGLTKALQPLKVVDGRTGAVVNGADFLVWQLRRTPSGIRPLAWPTGAFGQENPVTTDANGEAFVQLPPGGRYGLTIRHAGYRPLRLGPLSADFFSGGVIELTPVPTATPDREIVYAGSGFQQTIAQVPPGTTVRFINAGFGFVAFDEIFALAGVASTHSPSGLLGPGDDYQITFDTLGEVRIVNAENPTEELLIQVVEPTEEPDDEEPDDEEPDDEEPDDEEPDVTTTTIYLPFTTGPASE